MLSGKHSTGKAFQKADEFHSVASQIKSTTVKSERRTEGRTPPCLDVRDGAEGECAHTCVL